MLREIGQRRNFIPAPKNSTTVSGAAWYTTLARLSQTIIEMEKSNLKTILKLPFLMEHLGSLTLATTKIGCSTVFSSHVCHSLQNIPRTLNNRPRLHWK